MSQLILSENSTKVLENGSKFITSLTKLTKPVKSGGNPGRTILTAKQPTLPPKYGRHVASQDVGDTLRFKQMGYSKVAGKEIAIDDLDDMQTENKLKKDKIERQLLTLRTRIDKNKKILEDARRKMEEVSFSVERIRLGDCRAMNMGDCLELPYDQEHYEQTVMLLRSRIEHARQKANKVEDRGVSDGVKKMNESMRTTLSKLTKNSTIDIRSSKKI